MKYRGLFFARWMLLFSSCALFLGCPALCSSGERVHFQKLSIENGLPRSTVLSICQDHKGFLWIATYDGAARYDGVQFKCFRHRSDDPASLGQDFVRHIYEDRLGILWFATENGLSRFNREKETFTTYHADAKDSTSLTNNHPRRIYEDKGNALWITTEGGLNRYDRNRDAFVQYRNDPADAKSLGNGFIRAIVEDSDGRLWLGTGAGLDMFDRESNAFKHIRFDPKDPGSLSGNIITSLAEDRFGELWVGTRDAGLNRLPPGSTKFVRYRHNPADPHGLRSDNISEIFEDRSGDLWIGTNGGGLEKYDRVNDRFVHHQNNPADPGSISSNLVLCLFEDQGRILYVGTDFGGMNMVDRRKNRFTYYAHEPGKRGTLNESNVHAIFEDPADSGKTLWIGTRLGGLSLFNRRTGTFAAFEHDPADPRSLSSNTVRCITKDRRGALWVGTNNGLNRFDGRTGKSVRYTSDSTNPASLRVNAILTVYIDRKGALWIGTNRGGLEEYDREHDAFIHHLPDPGDSSSISDNTIWCILEDRAGNLWIGTNDGGLNLYDRAQRRFTRFMKTPSSNSISENKVLCMCEDQTGMLWIGTAGGGLNRFDPVSRQFTCYDEHRGLESNTIQAIVEDDRGHLWISTPHGIARFIPGRGVSINFDAHDGVQSNEFQVNAACRSVTGEIFFGGLSGLNAFFPGLIEPNLHAPPVVITGFQLFNTPVLQGREVDGRILLDTSITEAHTLALSYRDEVFTLEFAALDFASPHKNQYAYRMDGFDKDWNTVGNRHHATYTRLPAGGYVFRVKGSNNSGVWNQEGVALVINITPAFWQTWWFGALMALLVVGAIVTAYGIRARAVRRHTRELERRVSERTVQLEAANRELEAFAYSVSHDLRSPLRAIDGFSRILAEDHATSMNADSQRTVAIVRDEVRRMGQLIDDLLAFSRSGRSEVHRTEINMSALVNDVYNDITTPEQRERIDFSVTPLASARGDLALLRQVWINLLSNAIKFSSKRPRASIQIGSRDANGVTTYLVRDNGAGFDMQYADKLFGVFQRLHSNHEFEGTGVGLAIVQRLILKHGGRVWAEAVVDKGTTVYFTLPQEGNQTAG